MATTDSDTKTYFEGYSDYETVAQDIGKAVRDAVDAYSHLDAQQRQAARGRGANAAAQAHQHILAAAIRLVPELQRDRDSREKLDEIYVDWTGDDGYIQRLKNTQLEAGSPDWLYEFVVQIREAAWELGYLQAGRTEKAEAEDPNEEEPLSMFEEA
ncbi:hypothetical protein D3D02_16985 [Halobellus sp. Atlit-38R]|uniref:hypothetical protein n=1 Tax=Halobellus sp. Atlit-38R TaxID=2282131 RepID=UPI000EF184E9|nr:hypothetical protein [Halobellus sp. Atlit-38R]RLM83697.1 hypothetical protein D3D02_16985 [Halobellus sp. Atlit-38R]